MSRFRRAQRLELCPRCGEKFVYPVTWTESGPADWWLLLRCGACGTWRDVIASNCTVEAFDQTLDEHMHLIRCEAERMARESLAAQAETLGAALRLDLLTADDFR
jgi:hypothetical protein